MALTYGFTGTRNGLNENQKNQIIKLLDENNIKEVYHGDCVGANTDFHNLCQNKNIKIIIHPPNISIMRSFCQSPNILKPKPFLDRNKDIVNNCDILIACPENDKEVLRSGTWSTIRYAKKINKPVLLFV